MARRKRRPKDRPRKTVPLDQWIHAVRKEEAGMPMVRTSDALIRSWNRQRIVDALVRETMLVQEQFNIPSMSQVEARAIAKEVEVRIQKMQLPFVSAPLIREIQNQVLLERAKNEPRFAVYRNALTRVGVPMWDFSHIITGKGYEAQENANMQPNPETIHKKAADRLCKEAYLLMLPPEIADAHLAGDIHIHDLEYFGTRPFCADYDARYFFKYGLMCDGLGERTAVAKPATYPTVAILHLIKVLAAGQTNSAGGQGVFNFNVFLAPYIRGKSLREIEQLAQTILFEANETYVSRGGQLVFSSIQLEAGIPKIWRDAPVVYKGKIGPDTYGDYEDEARVFMKAILEQYLRGDAWGKMFTFPKPEIRLRREYFTKSEYEEIMYLAAKLSAKFGSSYFDNVIPPWRDADGQDCYQCCAFRLEEDIGTEEFKQKIMFEDGKHFSMGGLQVVSINLPRLAYNANGNDTLLLDHLRKQMDLAKRVLLIKRKFVQRQIENGMLPFLTQQAQSNGEKAPPLFDVLNMSPIFGFVGVNEMVQHHTGSQLHESKDAVRFGLRVLAEMEKIRGIYAEETGLPFAVARTPAESCSTRLAIMDLLHYNGEAISVVKGDTSNWRSLLETAGRTAVPAYYTNGFMVDYDAHVSLAQKIAIEEKAFPLLSGGNIFHVFLGEIAPDPEALAKLNQRIAMNTQLGYYSYTRDLSVCKQCHHTAGGLIEVCPLCGNTKLDWFSRITGYYQNVSGWNAGKREELKRRYRHVNGLMLSQQKEVQPLEQSGTTKVTDRVHSTH
ncbi:MAG: anaerobic ribonucleoside-triphosphate reductase [Candidatus Thorarchaeota archaeon]